ncbi:hypothetical protein COLO4_02533 [Corchorus olitorius]|uniref:Uncharacterized protein n=1 Tax=Corchorus olitorius TaxID=93759 RepID=A0A1R3L0X4_9ROSI|nr:hypothetical protein COLO4_02533 [Corchorus olitorius]
MVLPGAGLNRKNRLTFKDLQTVSNLAVPFGRLSKAWCETLPGSLQPARNVIRNLFCDLIFNPRLSSYRAQLIAAIVESIWSQSKNVLVMCKTRPTRLSPSQTLTNMYTRQQLLLPDRIQAERMTTT